MNVIKRQRRQLDRVGVRLETAPIVLTERQENHDTYTGDQSKQSLCGISIRNVAKIFRIRVAFVADGSCYQATHRHQYVEAFAYTSSEERLLDIDDLLPSPKLRCTQTSPAQKYGEALAMLSF